MTQEQIRKHVNEMKRWADAPNGTKVWYKMKAADSWALDGAPAWLHDILYIVNDEWAELRKAQADGKQLQLKLYSGAEWRDGELSYSGMSIGNPTHWRLKPEAEFPVYFLSKGTNTVYRFDDEETATAVITNDSKTTIGKEYPLRIRYCNTDRWRKLSTVTIDGITYYDTQPVWSWDGDSSVRYVKFIDAVNKAAFNIGGARHGATYDHYAPIEYIEDWMVEAWKKLKI